jgi:hypothetical protein
VTWPFVLLGQPAAARWGRSGSGLRERWVSGATGVPCFRSHHTWGDQGDGTYVNPVLPGDFSDWDCIRVGSDYYGITSTFGYSPGVAVLHSTDLVNWRTLGGVVDDVTRIGPLLNWDRMNRFGRGVWAGAIRFHAGRYWVYFTAMVHRDRKAARGTSARETAGITGACRKRLHAPRSTRSSPRSTPRTTAM